MNIILLHPRQKKNGIYTLTSPNQYKHINKVLKAKEGDAIKVGEINGLMGRANILHIDREKKQISLQAELNQSPPPALNTTLLLAMVRPKSLKKALHIAISMGIKNIIIMKTWRVEKSFWSSPVLETDSLEKIAIEALEQAKDTIMPTITIKKRFKPFLEDELAPLVHSLDNDKQAFVAHPIAEQSFFDASFKHNKETPSFLAIGPEGGFIDYEIEKLQSIGFQVCQLNQRILRVEFAIPVILSRLS